VAEYRCPACKLRVWSPNRGKHPRHFCPTAARHVRLGHRRLTLSEWFTAALRTMTRPTPRRRCTMAGSTTVSVVVSAPPLDTAAPQAQEGN
jgi:hypothetical protein